MVSVRCCVPVCGRARARVCWFVVLVWRVGVCVGGRACVRGPPSGVLWRFPTLPHPLGCSTIGAAGLSFQVRNVAGRFPGAVTTTRLCRPPPLVGPSCGGVGGGLVVVRIVVAASSFFRVTAPRPCPLRAGRCWGAVRFGGLGGWCGVGPLVPVGSRAPRGASTSGLSTRCSGGGLSPLVGGVETSSRSGLPA